MRRFIVDTDTASDDAAALMIAALSEEIDLLGVTIVAGNVWLKQATDNALMTLEVCGSDAPVYLGAKRPLFRERHETISVHGKDGMGDCDIIHPKRSPEEKRAPTSPMRRHMMCFCASRPGKRCLTRTGCAMMADSFS